MALIKCTECGKEVSDKASCCPNCGCPIEEILKSTNGTNSESNSKSTEHNSFESSYSNNNNIDLLLLSKLYKKYPEFPTYAAEEYASIKKISKAEAKKIVTDYYKTAPRAKFKGDSRPKKKHGILKTLLAVVGALFVFVVIVGSCGSDEEVKNVTPVSSETADSSDVSEIQETATVTDSIKSFSLGEIAEYNNVQVSVTECKQSSGTEWSTPEAGKTFVFLNLEIVNNSDEEITISSMASFEAYCDDYKLNYSSNAFMALIDVNAQQLDGSIAPGKKLNGYLGLEVPSDWKTIELYYKDNAWLGSNFKFVFNKKQ